VIRRLRSSDGFALPLTIFVITIVTLMLATLFIRVQVDRRIAESSGDVIDALAIAQSGLEAYFGSQSSSRPVDGDSARINVTGGYANVIANVVREPADTFANWTYVVRSTGFVIEPTMGSDPQATRTIAQFAEWQTGQLSVPAAYTAVNRVRHLNQQVNGVDVDGNDNCGSMSSIYGIRTRNGSTLVSNGLHGSPQAYLIANNADTVAGLTQIDWASTVAGGMDADYTSFTPGWGMGTVTIVNGDLTISNNWGAGILIVTGDLTMTSGWGLWYGIVLVGGKVNFNASIWNYVRGALVSGLNATLQGGSPGQTDIGKSGTHTYIYYDSCYIDDALEALTGFRPVEGGWVDNWAGY
jgi:Tfp pilus assembly protein PilX